MIEAYRVLETGGGAEGAADWGVIAGLGTWRTGAGDFFFVWFSCSFSDMAMASCKSSSSCIFCSVPPPPAALGVAVEGVCDSWARELRRYSSGRSLLRSAAALAPSLKTTTVAVVEKQNFLFHT